MAGMSIGNRLRGTTALSNGLGLSLGNRLYFAGFGPTGLTPAMLLDFATDRSLVDSVGGAEVEFTRSGHATMYDSTGKLTWAPNNLVKYNSDYSNGVWQKINNGTGSAVPSVTPNQANDVNGDLIADEIVFEMGGTKLLLDSIDVKNSSAFSFLSMIKLCWWRPVR